jgi:hypothetical protein
MATVIDNATQLPVQNIQREAFKVGATEKGSMDGRVSSEWFSRPDDQRFTSLNDLHAYTAKLASKAKTDLINVTNVKVLADRANPNDLRLLATCETRNNPVEARMNHWSFGQACSLIGAPASYLRKLPAALAGINMQYGINQYRGEMVKLYTAENGENEIRAFTSPDYGRIFDHEIVKAVQRIAGNGTGDSNWKIPGVMDWTTGMYNPNAAITKQSTTLFASDRDVFMFLVDDAHPIEVGKLNDGSPDLMFRGFYVWNSEVGARSFGLSAFYLRGVCQNRCLWGVEGRQDFTFRHSKGAPDRFALEMAPQLQHYAAGRTDLLIEGVKKAKGTIVASDNDGAREFLGGLKFTKKTVDTVLETVLREEGNEARSIWDMVQGITAVARTEGHQDERLAMERVAGRLLDKVA